MDSGGVARGRLGSGRLGGRGLLLKAARAGAGYADGGQRKTDAGRNDRGVAADAGAGHQPHYRAGEQKRQRRGEDRRLPLVDPLLAAPAQHQPKVALYPDDEITTRYLVVNGCHWLAAAHKCGRTDPDVVVNDTIARDRATLLSAAITENADRQDFDVIEEARAVEALVAECGLADLAGQRLHRTEGWVSQLRALLKLPPTCWPTRCANISGQTVSTGS